MVNQKSAYRYLILAFPLILILSLILITLSVGFKENAKVFSMALTFDLLITIPLFYFLLIRKSKISKTTIVPLMILGMVTGKYLIPGEHQYYLDLFQSWALPLIEISVVSFVIFKVYKTVQSYRVTREDTPDFYSALTSTCREVLPKPVAIPFATEIAVFYYGFFLWKKKKLRENEFSYHKESGSVSLFAVLIFLIIIETVVLHILLALWNETIAWVLSLVSVYTILQLFGFLRSMYNRPIIISTDKLILRYGIMKEVEIDLGNIASIEISDREIECDEKTAKLALLDKLESHNMILHLHRKSYLTGLYGNTKEFEVIALHVDDKEKFRRKLEALIS